MPSPPSAQRPAPQTRPDPRGSAGEGPGRTDVPRNVLRPETAWARGLRGASLPARACPKIWPRLLPGRPSPARPAQHSPRDRGVAANPAGQASAPAAGGRPPRRPPPPRPPRSRLASSPTRPAALLRPTEPLLFSGPFSPLPPEPPRPPFRAPFLPRPSRGPAPPAPPAPRVPAAQSRAAHVTTRPTSFPARGPGFPRLPRPEARNRSVTGSSRAERRSRGGRSQRAGGSRHRHLPESGS